MKSNEEILKSKGITEHSANHNYEYLYKSVLESMKEAQIEVLNDVLDKYVKQIGYRVPVLLIEMIQELKNSLND
jgi:hypothetical protein